jgi:glycosyltransferase involved in cell wall biosynthesis
MRVMHVVHSLTVGDGVAAVVLHLVRQLQQRGIEHAIACLAARGERAREAEDLGAEVFAIGAHSSASPRHVPHNVLAIARLIRLLRRQRPDVVHTHEFFSGTLGRIAARAAAVPAIVLTLHNTDLWKRRPHIAVDRLLARRTHRIVANSAAVRSFVLERERLDPQHVTVIHNGIDLGRFARVRDPLVARHRLGLGPRAAVVGTVGGLVEQKGHIWLLRAATKLREHVPRLRVVLVGGDGHPSECVKPQLLDTVRRLGLQDTVLFLGKRTDIPEILPAFDVFVLPSEWEGFGLVLVEAMASGLPIVATAVGGVPEVIGSPEVGTLVPPKNASVLADAILSLLRDGKRRGEMGRLGRQRAVACFSAERMAADYRELYASLLGQEEAVDASTRARRSRSVPRTAQ